MRSVVYIALFCGLFAGVLQPESHRLLWSGAGLTAGLGAVACVWSKAYKSAQERFKKKPTASNKRRLEKAKKVYYALLALAGGIGVATAIGGGMQWRKSLPKPAALPVKAPPQAAQVPVSVPASIPVKTVSPGAAAPVVLTEIGAAPVVSVAVEPEVADVMVPPEQAALPAKESFVSAAIPQQQPLLAPNQVRRVFRSWQVVPEVIDIPHEITQVPDERARVPDTWIVYCRNKRTPTAPHSTLLPVQDALPCLTRCEVPVPAELRGYPFKRAYRLTTGASSLLILEADSSLYGSDSTCKALDFSAADTRRRLSSTFHEPIQESFAAEHTLNQYAMGEADLYTCLTAFEASSEVSTLYHPIEFAITHCYGNTALVAAKKAGRLVNGMITDEEGRTPFEIALRYGTKAHLDYWLEFFDPAASTEYVFEPLREALPPYESCMKLGIDADCGALMALALSLDSDCKNTQIFDQTPFMYAITAGKPHAVQWFLDNRERLGLDVEQKNGAGQTAFLVAVAMQRPSIVEKLLASGVDPLAVENDGTTALMYAARGKNTKVFDLVFGKTCQNMDYINCADHDRVDALLYALGYGRGANREYAPKEVNEYCAARLIRAGALRLILAVAQIERVRDTEQADWVKIEQLCVWRLLRNFPIWTIAPDGEAKISQDFMTVLLFLDKVGYPLNRACLLDPEGAHTLLSLAISQGRVEVAQYLYQEDGLVLANEQDCSSDLIRLTPAELEARLNDAKDANCEVLSILPIDA